MLLKNQPLDNLMAQFFNRDADRAKIWRYFNKQQSLLMLAPRRIGKTELLHQLQQEAGDHDFRAVVCDVEGCSEEKQFFREICRAIEKKKGASALWSNLTARLGKLLHGNETAPTTWQQWLVHMDYKDFAEALLEELNNDSNRWIVMVDEMPIFVLALLNDGERQRTHDFLYWLRNLRQRYSNVLWLYTGSIGLDTVSRREDLEGAFNNMQPITLPPFAETEASEFLSILAQRDGFVLGDAGISHILQRLGWLSPYYLEKLVDEIILTGGNRDEACPEDIDRACEALLSRGKQLYWSAWREHLNNNFKEPERGLLYQVLETVAQDPSGADFDTLLGVLSRSNPGLTERQLRHALDVLESDGYLIADTERTRFRFLMDLLRLWWLRYAV